MDPNTTLEQFLLAVPEQESLFAQLGMDVRRERNQPFVELCRRHKLDWPTLGRLLTALQKTSSRPVAALELMALPELCDHLELAQRRRVQEELKQLDELTKTAAEQSGAAQPQLRKIRAAFIAFHEPFAAHLRAETETHFPLIRRLTTGENGGQPAGPALKSRLAQMAAEHNQADEALAELHALAGAESAQRPVPAAMRTVAEAIVRLENAVHEQIYQENQVLFPRALAVEGAGNQPCR